MIMSRVLSLAAFLALFSLSAIAADPGKQLDAAAQVLQSMSSSNQIPSSLLKESKCIAVIPKMTKAGFIVGGKHGNGVVACRTTSGWSAPAFISMTGGSVGLQAGGEQQDLVLLLNSQGAQELKGGHWDMSAEAAAAGPTGEAAGTASTGWKAPVLSYSNGSGAFAGMSVGGSKIGTDEDAIKEVYGKGASFDSILDGAVPSPRSASQFTSALEQLAK